MAEPKRSALDRWFHGLAEITAATGGLGLVLMTVLVVISIIGRSLIWAGLQPIPGDTELVEAITAFVVAAFMPICQLRRGHASVSILTDLFGNRANLLIELITDALLFGLAVFLTWRHSLGLMDKFKYGEVTFMLQFPVWWGYLGTLFGLVIWVMVGAYCTFRSGRDLVRGSSLHMSEMIH